jgi:beta-glucosidase
LHVKPSADGYGADAMFTITNTGSIAGATVGQVYVHQCRPSVEKPDIELATFAKVYLAPGESKVVSVNLEVSVE